MSSHHEILKKAIQVTKEGSILESKEVYYECRKPPQPRQKFNSENRQIYYLGKLNSQHAECVSVNPISDYALVGKVIGFQCSEKPAESHLFQFREMHKGSFGILEGSVYCRILSQFQYGKLYQT